MKAVRSPLVTALLGAAILVVGCGPPDGGSSSGLRAPRFDPAPGDYTEYVEVKIESDYDIRVSQDPNASYLEFEPWWGNEFVTDGFYIRAYALNDSGQRSAIVEANYTVTDPAAPVISSNGIHQDLGNTDYFGFGFYWDVTRPEDGDPNPSDDLTDWYGLTAAVYSSLQDNISTIEDAEANGTLIRDWSSMQDAYAYCPASRPGEGHYVNVFVRDEHGNVSAYGAVRLESRAVRDVYLGREVPVDIVDDTVWLNRADGSMSKIGATPLPDLENTHSVALRDLDGDGLDDLIACYEDTHAMLRQAWFRATGSTDLF